MTAGSVQPRPQDAQADQALGEAQYPMGETTQATGETEAPQTEQDAVASVQRLEDSKSFKESGKGSSAKSRITAVSASVAK